MVCFKANVLLQDNKVLSYLMIDDNCFALIILFLSVSLCSHFVSYSLTRLLFYKYNVHFYVGHLLFCIINNVFACFYLILYRFLRQVYFVHAFP